MIGIWMVMRPVRVSFIIACFNLNTQEHKTRKISVLNVNKLLFNN